MVGFPLQLQGRELPPDSKPASGFRMYERSSVGVKLKSNDVVLCVDVGLCSFLY